MRLELTAVYRKVPEGGYVAWAEEYPGALTQGDTLEDARANLDDAVRLLIEANRDMHATTENEQQVIREPLLIAD
ncbi:type II toxin-antitoxin system HicB family antitoxin [Longimicrobium sp.]|uniref:type II toxin-antitoxin system HicB family antitoxin n=1 Tax=Longimicrobium sp. TaxID=2029185 RepID=UPI003B3ADDEA